MPPPPRDESPIIPHWDKRGETLQADCRVFRVVRRTFHHPRREISGDFFVLDSVDWVNVVAATPAGELVLVTQFRFGVENLSLEVPGGLIEPGEDPVAAARRELQEETGFLGGEARLLGSIHPNPAIQSNRCHLVMIDGVEHAPGLTWDEHEEIHTALVPAARAFDLARTGGITHALTLNAFFFFEPIWRARGGASAI